MIYLGIDVAKHKHDCFITNSDGEVLRNAFTITNSMAGFQELYETILSFEPNPTLQNMRIGLEATGHYSNNLIDFLLTKNLNPVVLNPLSTNLFRKGQSLRKTKTDKSDARFITMMLITEDVKPYTPVSYHIQELKALTRHRFRLVQERSRLKISYTRILDIVFPELHSIVWATTQKSMLLTLLELPNTKAIADCHLTRFTNILVKNSYGHYRRDKAVEIRELARNSIGSNSPALAFELQQVIRTILFLQEEITLLDKQIKKVMQEIDSPIMSIPGISYTLAAIILSEIGDVSMFESPAKLLAFAGLEPSTYQSGKFTATHATMVKRGSKYLRWAILTAVRLVCMRDAAFKAYRDKKLLEGKHFFVALSHTAKKMTRVIFYLLKNNQRFVAQAV
jgi:transposase